MVKPPSDNRPVPVNQPESPDVVAARLAAAHERAGRLLSDRYEDRSLTDADFERLLARLRDATDLASVDAVIEELHHIPRLVHPMAGSPEARSVALPDEERRILAVMSEQKRKGRWSVPRTLRVMAVMANVRLDFRHTDIPHGLTIDVNCIMSSVTIVVPPDVAVDFNVFAMLGSSDSAAHTPHDAPLGARTMTVTGGVIMGETKVVVRAK